MDQSNDGLLAGIKVLEFGQFFAGPTASRMMTDMGAEVVKVEFGPHGDHLRGYLPEKAGLSGIFMLENRGKESICLDIGTEEGRQIARELAAVADVLIENYSPGVLNRRGLGYEDLRKLNPRLIMCSISGFGQTGPLSYRNGNDTMAVAMSGLTHLTGDPNGAPTYIGASIADANAGIHAFSAICAALFNRAQTGLGRYLDISLVESLFNLHDNALARYIISNGADNPMRTGSHLSGPTPCGIFKARDGYMIITVLIHQWENFANTIGKPELLTDPRFNPPTERAKHMPELIAIIEQWLQSFPTRDEPLKLLAEHRVLSAPVLDIGEAMNHPQMKARGVMQPVDHPGVGPIPLPRAPFHVSGASVEIRARTPYLGEHNETVLARYLGYSTEKVAELTRAGVLIAQAMPK
ncbi:MAG TPA: CoA transferase [Candidatus Binataceae bacterium]|jgi:CoA:oxalate CoA-transferase|nr:CoA transferase [Candidatus Binataceae bacterium]